MNSTRTGKFPENFRIMGKPKHQRQPIETGDKLLSRQRKTPVIKFLILSVLYVAVKRRVHWFRHARIKSAPFGRLRVAVAEATQFK